MENQLKEIFGALIAAIGTITSAIGSTPFYFISSNVREDLNIYGNTLQAVGNALEADGQEGISLEKIGTVPEVYIKSEQIQKKSVTFKKI